MCLSLPQTENGSISPEAFSTLSSSLSRIATIAVGPGLTHHPETIKFFEQLLNNLQNNFTGTVVIDADGLNCLSLLQPQPILSSRFVLTPHLGECARLTKMSSEAIQSDLLGACQKTAEQYQATVILKSASSVVYHHNDGFWINPTGNPGMSTAGSGDVLTGLLAGFLAQGLNPIHAAQLSVYLHGLSGDIAIQDLTPYCLTATDLIRYLPKAIQRIQPQMS
jgi:NAD(P)H-hydrate epimerase